MTDYWNLATGGNLIDVQAPVQRPEAVPRPGSDPGQRRPQPNQAPGVDYWRQAIDQKAQPAEEANPPAAASSGRREQMLRDIGQLQQKYPGLLEDARQRLLSQPETPAPRAAPAIPGNPEQPTQGMPQDASMSPQVPAEAPNRTGGFAAPNLNVGVVEDSARGFGAGLAKGVLGVGSLPGTLDQLGRTGINYVADKIGAQGPVVRPTSSLPQYSDARRSLEQNFTGPLYDAKTRTGKFAERIGEFAPGVLFPGAQAGMAARVVGNVVAPALGSEAAGQLTEGTKLEPYARVAGALAGPSIAARTLTPFQADPVRTQAVQRLRGEGVTALTAGQETGRMPLRWVESAVRDTPFTGARAQNMSTQAAEQYTAATLRRAGINANRATPEVIDQAFTRIGGEFDAVAQGTLVPVAGQLPTRVQQIVRNYERVTEPSLVNPLPRAIADDLAQLAQSRQPAAIPGDMYAGWRSDIGAAARAARDPRTERALYELQRALDDAAEGYLRRTNPQLGDRMRTARREYRNMLVIEKAANQAGENAALGLISPAALANATRVQDARAYARGQGDFARLARDGSAIMRELPQSGTAPRLVATEIGKIAAGSLIGGAAAGPEGAAYGALAPLIGQALLGRAVMSRPAQAYLRNQGNQRAAINQQRRAALLPPVASEFSDKREPR